MVLKGKRYFFCTFFALTASLYPCITKAQQAATVRSVIDSTHILIGEQFHLKIEAGIDSSHGKLIWAAIPDTFNHIEVVSRGRIDTARENGRLHYSQQLTLTSFDSGMWKIPPFTFNIISPQGAVTGATNTDSFYISVNTVSVDTTQPFKPIKTVRQVSVSWKDYIWYIILGALIVLAIFAIVYYIRESRKKPAPPLPPKPKETPYEAAIKALRRMEEEKAWQNGEIKQYYTALTDVLREYIERQFQVPAMELTTDELLQNIKPVTILNQQKDPLRLVLTTADLVKFAKMHPGQEEHYDCLRRAIEIVEWTKPKPKEGENK